MIQVSTTLYPYNISRGQLLYFLGCFVHFFKNTYFTNTYMYACVYIYIWIWVFITLKSTNFHHLIWVINLHMIRQTRIFIKFYYRNKEKKKHWSCSHYRPGGAGLPHCPGASGCQTSVPCAAGQARLAACGFHGQACICFFFG